MSQTVCPYNVKFAQALPDHSPFAPRGAIAGKDARTLAREVLAMDPDAYRAAFRGSPMKRAKLPAMKRNAAVVLGNVGTADDVDVLARALDDAEPLVREHAAWALGRLGSSAALAPLRARADVETEPWVLDELRAAARALEGLPPNATCFGAFGAVRGMTTPVLLFARCFPGTGSTTISTS